MSSDPLVYEQPALPMGIDYFTSLYINTVLKMKYTVNALIGCYGLSVSDHCYRIFIKHNYSFRSLVEFGSQIWEPQSGSDGLACKDVDTGWVWVTLLGLDRAVLTAPFSCPTRLLDIPPFFQMSPYLVQ